MLPLAYYLLKVIICSGILYGYYWLLLRNKIFHKYNRFYLMVSVVLSLLMPLIKINFWQPTAEQPSGVIKVLQVVSSGDEYMDNIIVSTNNNAASFDVTQLYPFAYLLVSLILLTVFLHTLFVIFNLLKKYPKQTIDKISFINTDAKSTPFSFLNYIFWNHNIDMQTITGNQIFKHEVAHVEEKHTYDKLFINIVLIFFWCNPFYWLYRKELNMIHEFIADKKAVEDSDTEAFAAMILQATYPQHRFQLTNNFFYSPIKRRLQMLIKNKNPKVNYVGRIMVLPLLILIFAAFTFKAKPINHYYHGKKITVVIDAGHGGGDGGAKAIDGTLEKDLTLAIVKKIKELNSNEAIEILLTRDDDSYLTPMEKTDFAIKNKADLFISFHTDNGPKGTENKRSGISFWVAKDASSNLEKSKIFATAIINEFNKNYSIPVIDEINQRQANIAVLSGNTCPAVLIESGFINNEQDLAYLKTDKAKETIAKNILNAVEVYLSDNLKGVINKNVPQAVNDSTISVMQSGSTKDSTSKYLDTPKLSITFYGFNSTSFDSKSTFSGIKKEYQGKAITHILIDKELVVLTLENKQKIKMNQDEAIKRGIFTRRMPIPNNLSDQVLTAIKTNGTPLYIVDGVEMENNFDLDKIKPDDITDVTVLKDKSAIALYGEKGKDGVVKISTKQNKIKEEIIVKGYKKDNTGEVILEGYKSKSDKANEKAVRDYKGLNPLYIIDGKEATEATMKAIDPNQIKSVDVLKDEKAIEKYGEKGKNGVIKISLKKEVITFKNPTFSYGNLTRHHPTIEEFKKQTTLNVSDGYVFVSATVYFAGTNFPKVETVLLNSNSTKPLQNLLDKCTAGTTIVFENLRVSRKDIGLITIDGHSYQLSGGGENDLKTFNYSKNSSSFNGGNIN